MCKFAHDKKTQRLIISWHFFFVSSLCNTPNFKY